VVLKGVAKLCNEGAGRFAHDLFFQLDALGKVKVLDLCLLHLLYGIHLSVCLVF
jgi:hypothetical protein